MVSFGHTQPSLTGGVQLQPTPTPVAGDALLQRQVAGLKRLHDPLQTHH